MEYIDRDDTYTQCFILQCYALLEKYINFAVNIPKKAISIYIIR